MSSASTHTRFGSSKRRRTDGGASASRILRSATPREARSELRERKRFLDEVASNQEGGEEQEEADPCTVLQAQLARTRCELAQAKQQAAQLAVQLAQATQLQYEWQNEYAQWKPYASDVNSRICAAAAAGLGSVAFSAGNGQSYTLFLACMQQRNNATAVQRVVRKVQSQAFMPSVPPPRVACQYVNRYTASETKFYTLTQTVAVGFESYHFNNAAAQFMLLLPGRKVTRVDYYENAAVKQRFHANEAALRARGVSVDKTWVFHGTSSATLPQIMSQGFKVGGSGVPVANGSCHGHGVYTATGPSTAISYAQNSGRVILAQGMKGAVGLQGVSDSWVASNNSSICVFRSGEQLLPVYVVYFT